MYKIFFIPKLCLILLLMVFTVNFIFAQDLTSGSDASSSSNQVFLPSNLFVWGDVDGNQRADIVDALLIARFDVGLISALKVSKAADVNADESINIIDSLYIARKYVGMIKKFPAELKAPRRRVKLNERFTIQYGEKVIIEETDMFFIFSEVTDSRCPTNVICKWAGEAVITLSIQGRSAIAGVLSLKNPPSDSSSKVYTDFNRDYRISCLQVEPYPVHGKPLSKDSYLATLVVEKIGPTAAPSPRPTFTPQEVPLDQKFELKFGERVNIKNEMLGFMFDSVRDTRCPSSLSCVRSGEAILGLAINNKVMSAPIFTTIKSPPHDSSVVDFSEYRIFCLSIDPYPLDKNPIAQEDYRATFIVTKSDLPKPTKTPAKTPSPEVRVVYKNEKFKIRYGETVRLNKGHFFLKFKSVKDNRCPLKAPCDTIGGGTIGVEIQEGSIEPTLFLIKDIPSSVYTRPKVSCLALDPYPVSGKPIVLEDYVATLIIEDNKPSE